MAQKSRANLKARFLTGMVPTQADYADLFDSQHNLTDDDYPDANPTGDRIVELTSGGNSVPMADGEVLVLVKVKTPTAALFSISTSANGKEVVEDLTTAAGQWVASSQNWPANGAVMLNIGTLPSGSQLKLYFKA
jgi:hypothetical protein